MKSCVMVFAVLMAGVAVAQGRTSKKKLSVEACLTASKAPPNSDACIGASSNRCIGPDECAKSSSEVVARLDGEQKQWDKVLNSSFQKLPEQQAKLRDMQRVWIDARDRTYTFY
jgi:hypothetical protein